MGVNRLVADEELDVGWGSAQVQHRCIRVPGTIGCLGSRDTSNITLQLHLHLMKVANLIWLLSTKFRLFLSSHMRGLPRWRPAVLHAVSLAASSAHIYVCLKG